MDRYYYNKNGKLVNRSLPYVTIALIVINVVIFLGMELIGDTEYSMYLYQDKGKKEWLGFNRLFESNLRRTGDI